MPNLTDLKVIEIYNAKGGTRAIAKKYELHTMDIAQIKGGRGQYESIIRIYKAQNLFKLNLGVFGHDSEYICFKKIRDAR